MRYLPDDNLSYPVLIQIGSSSGSGFYFRTTHKVFLVTALHVIFNESDEPRDNLVKLTSYDKDLSVVTPIEMTVDLSQVNIKKDNSKDIVLIEIGNLQSTNVPAPMSLGRGVQRASLTIANLVVIQAASLKRFSDVLISNEVFILGYPSSLGRTARPQTESNKPLLRKGIIAGKNTQNETIILDCPVYFGNSGGLAIEVEDVSPSEKTFRVIGIVSEYVPFVEELVSAQFGYTNTNFENSGYSVVVPIDTILDLAEENHQ